MRRCRVNDQTLDIASGVHVDKKKGSASGLQTTKHLQGCEDFCDGVDGVGRCSAGAPTGDWRGRRTDVFTVPEKCRAGLQTTTHFKRAPCLVRAAGLPHLRHHEVWFCTGDDPSPKGLMILEAPAAAKATAATSWMCSRT